MTFNRISYSDISATASYTSFCTETGVAEFHAIIEIDSCGEMFEQQIARVYEAEERLYSSEELHDAKIIFKRYFLSDAANQVPVMHRAPLWSNSYIQQPPLRGSKVAVWVYLQRGTEVTEENETVVVRHNGYTHLWKMGMMSNVGDSAEQTEKLLVDYEQTLDSFGANLADHCIRTWFFVRDVDIQYAGMVIARRNNFIEQGLTDKTHYIASTGIGGLPADQKCIVQLGTYAMLGFEPEQQRYLYALTHLNRTIEYGVTFERGTLLEFGDRRHIYISGTASINNKGQVKHVGNIVKQTHRMWENVSELLKEGDMTFDDVMQIVVYLRDTADYDIVARMFAEKFPNTPYVITLAPVCRPAWLIEMECIAVDAKGNAKYKAF